MAQKNSSHGLYQFSDLTLILGQRKLLRNGEEIKLTKIAFSVLRILVERAPNVVTYDEFADQVWGKERAVGPENLAQQIKTIRQALDENAKHPRYIEAVRGEGYRLIVQVNPVAPTSKSPSVAKRFTLRRTVILAASACLVLFSIVIGLLLSVNLGEIGKSGPPQPPPNSELANQSQSLPTVIVFPFLDISTEADNDLFVDGVYLEVITQLSKQSNLKVIARNSLTDLLRQDYSYQQISRQLGATQFIEGSLQKFHSSFRINVQLTDVVSGVNLWAETYEGDLSAENIFTTQTQIAQSIAKALKVNLSQTEQLQLTKVPTTNTRAYQLYLSGNAYLRRGNVRTNVPIAVLQFQQALKEDSDFALAWASLAASYSVMHVFRIDASEQRLQLARSAAEHAIDLDPRLPEAYYARALYLERMGQYRDARTALDRAHQLGLGQFADAWFLQAIISLDLHQYRQAIPEFEQALLLDPRNPNYLEELALLKIYLREYGEAESHLDEALAIAPDVQSLHVNKALILFRSRGDISYLESLGDKNFFAPANRTWAAWAAAMAQKQYAKALTSLNAYTGETLVNILGYYIPTASAYARTYQALGDRELATNHWQTATQHLQRRLNENPDDLRLQVAMAEVLAYGTDPEAAVSKATQLLEYIKTEPSLYGGLVEKLHSDIITRILLPAGTYEMAVREIERYLAGPGSWTINGFLALPGAEPIKDHPTILKLTHTD